MTSPSRLAQCRRGDAQQLKAGVDALERGDFVDVDGPELEDYFKRLVPRV